MPTVAPGFLARYFGLDERVALVTGASGDIGAAIAAGLAAAGATVMLTGRNRSNLQQVRESIRADGGHAEVVAADLSAPAACREIVQRTVDDFGRLDILVNCAGANRRQPILAVTPEGYDELMAVNLRATYFVCQATARAMSSNDGGKIINVGSLTCSIGLADVSVYGAAKAALAALTKTMAVEWATHNIQVNCLAPGFFLTSLTRDGLWGDEAKRAWMLDRIPMRRPGLPDDLVGMALYMASPASAYMTGQTVTIDGGFLAGSPW